MGEIRADAALVDALQFRVSLFVDAVHCDEALQVYVVTLRVCVPLQLFAGMLQLLQLPVCVVSHGSPAFSPQLCVSLLFCVTQTPAPSHA